MCCAILPPSLISSQCVQVINVTLGDVLGPLLDIRGSAEGLFSNAGVLHREPGGSDGFGTWWLNVQ